MLLLTGDAFKRFSTSSSSPKIIAVWIETTRPFSVSSLPGHTLALVVESVLAQADGPFSQVFYEPLQ